MLTASQTKFLNQRLLSVLLLGFASGLPLALTGSTLQAWLTQSHISLMTIGALSLLGVPYTLKFLWAPLMDYLSIPKWGRRKGFILLTQCCMILSLLILAEMSPSSQIHSMMIIAFMLAFLSASQDIAINAYQTDILHRDERGLGVAYSTFAYRIAMFASGGLALVMADWVGWRITYDMMALLMLAACLLSFAIPKTNDIIDQTHHHLWRTLCAGLYNLLQRKKIIWLLLFILFYKIGDAFALSLMTNFLLQGLGFTLTQVGLAYKVGGVIATLCGTFIGGLLLMRISNYRALLCFGLAQAFSNLTFVILAGVGKVFSFMFVAIFIEHFCSGLSTAALLAFMMALCDHRYTASQFALLSAVASLGRVFLGPVAGFVVGQLGWTHFYLCAFLLSFPGILFLMMLKDHVSVIAPVAEEMA